MRPFCELRVWEASHALALRVYEATSAFPREETYGITSQMRRAAVSIPSNIAEGSARSDAEFHQFLRVALGSAAELEYQMLLSRDLGYLSEADHSGLDQDVTAIKRMLVSFARTVKESPAPRRDAISQRPMADGQQPEGSAR